MKYSAKHDDRAGVSVDHLDIHLYDGVPYVGILGGDYTNLIICMDCGLIHGWKPISDEEMRDVIG